MLSSSSPRAECLRQLQRAGLGWPRCGGEIFCNSSVGVVLAGGAQWRWSPQGQPELVEEVWSVAAVFTRGHWPLAPGTMGHWCWPHLPRCLQCNVCSVVLRCWAGPGLTVQSCVPVRMWQVTERGLEQNN